MRRNNLRDCFEKFPWIFWIFDLSIIEMWEVTWKLWDSIETIKLKEEKIKRIKNENNLSTNLPYGNYNSFYLVWFEFYWYLLYQK